MRRLYVRQGRDGTMGVEGGREALDEMLGRGWPDEGWEEVTDRRRLLWYALWRPRYSIGALTLMALLVIVIDIALHWYLGV